MQIRSTHTTTPPRNHKKIEAPKPSSSGSVGAITGDEFVSIGSAAIGGALVAGLGGFAVDQLGPVAGVSAAIVGEGALGAVSSQLILGDEGRSQVSTFVLGGGVGAAGGAVGSLAGVAARALTGSEHAGLIAGAATGALASGGFALWLALEN